jgi:hypothetical protein
MFEQQRQSALPHGTTAQHQDSLFELGHYFHSFPVQPGESQRILNSHEFECIRVVSGAGAGKARQPRPRGAIRPQEAPPRMALDAIPGLAGIGKINIGIWYFQLFTT